MSRPYQILRCRVIARRINRDAYAAITSWCWWVSLWPYFVASSIVFMVGFILGMQCLSGVLDARFILVPR